MNSYIYYVAMLFSLMFLFQLIFAKVLSPIAEKFGAFGYGIYITLLVLTTGPKCVIDMIQS